jgi:hypothetical protein
MFDFKSTETIIECASTTRYYRKTTTIQTSKKDKTTAINNIKVNIKKAVNTANFNKNRVVKPYAPSDIHRVKF